MKQPGQRLATHAVLAQVPGTGRLGLQRGSHANLLPRRRVRVGQRQHAVALLQRGLEEQARPSGRLAAGTGQRDQQRQSHRQTAPAT